MIGSGLPESICGFKPLKTEFIVGLSRENRWFSMTFLWVGFVRDEFFVECLQFPIFRHLNRLHVNKYLTLKKAVLLRHIRVVCGLKRKNELVKVIGPNVLFTKPLSVLLCLRIFENMAIKYYLKRPVNLTDLR